MSSEWRTVQVFLSPRQPAVFEVELNTKSAKARCSCPTFTAKKTCRHTKVVYARMTESGGQYPILLQEDAKEELLSESLADATKFREFIVRFGKVEVL